MEKKTAFYLTPRTSSNAFFPNQPLFREGIQVSGRTAAPYPLASLSGEGLEGGVAAVPEKDLAGHYAREGHSASTASVPKIR
jgi:hypothetical protein